MIRYRKGFKYQLAEDYYIILDLKIPKSVESDFLLLANNGVLKIFKGYAWDGASGITFDTKSSMRGALVHDALYQLMRMELISIDFRLFADKTLKRICIEDGMYEWRAEMWFKAVQGFADFAAEPKNLKKVEIA